MVHVQPIFFSWCASCDRVEKINVGDKVWILEIPASNSSDHSGGKCRSTFKASLTRRFSPVPPPLGSLSPNPTTNVLLMLDEIVQPPSLTQIQPSLGNFFKLILACSSQPPSLFFTLLMLAPHMRRLEAHNLFFFFFFLY